MALVKATIKAAIITRMQAAFPVDLMNSTEVTMQAANADALADILISTIESAAVTVAVTGTSVSGGAVTGTGTGGLS